jgi:CRISPR system Cascade subunit CasB
MNQQSDGISPSPVELSPTVAHFASTIQAEHYPTGDRAALRRWTPGQAAPLAFYRLWLCHIGGELPAESQTVAWMAVAWCAAVLPGGHVPKRSLGQALAESGFSEERLERLLSAPEDKRLELLLGTVRFLAAKGEGFDLVDAARFLLTSDPEKRESIHRRIAEGYYRHLPKK